MSGSGSEGSGGTALPDRAAAETRLRARLVELEELAESHEDDGRPVALDQARAGRLSRMDALQGQAMAVEVERRRELEIARVEAALERLADGSWGECLTCGEPIEERRLASDPSTPLCLGCAHRAD